MHTCAVSPSSLYFLLHHLSFPNLSVNFPVPACYVPSLSHLTPVPSSHSNHLLLAFIWKDLGGKEWQKQTSTFVTTPIFWSCLVNRRSFLFLMELRCLAGICSHATGREPSCLNQTYITSHLHEMWRFHWCLAALPLFNSWLCTATHCNSNPI